MNATPIPVEMAGIALTWSTGLFASVQNRGKEKYASQVCIFLRFMLCMANQIQNSLSTSVFVYDY